MYKRLRNIMSRSGISFRLRRLFRHPAVSGSIAASLFGQATLIISGPVTARLLGVTGRGELAILTIIAGIGSQIGAAGLPTAVAFTIARQHTSARAVLRVVTRTWVSLCLGAGILSGAAVILLPARPESVAWVAPLVAVLVVSTMTWALIFACLQGEGRFLWLNLLRPVYSTVVAVSLMGVLLSGRGATVTMVLGVLVAVNVATCVAGGFVVRASRLESSLTASVTARSMIKYGLASLAGGTQPLDSLSVDQAVVGVLLSRRQLGLYVVGSAFNNLASVLLSGLGTVALQRIASERDQGARRRAMKKVAVSSILIATFVTVVVELIVPTVLPLAFGAAFVGALPAARILIVAGFFLSIRRMLVVLLQAIGRPGHTGFGEAVGIGTLLMLAVVLIPAFGLIGASSALVGAAVAADVYLIVALRERRAARPSSADG